MPKQCMGAEWLDRLAERVEAGLTINPCPKALRRVANDLERLTVGRANDPGRHPDPIIDAAERAVLGLD